MLPKVLPSWQMRYLADGIGLFPPEGVGQGGLRIREYQRPLQSARTIIERALAALPTESLVKGPIQRITTCEGEYAALQISTGTTRGERFLRALGVVFGDDHYVLVDGGTTVADKFDFFIKGVRDLTYFYSLGLGHRRRRRFMYTPPAGFVGYPRGLCTLWHRSDYPRTHESITVWPAWPSDEPATQAVKQILNEMAWTGYSLLHQSDPVPVFSDHGLAGSHVRLEGSEPGQGPAKCDVVVLQDDRFVYVLRHSHPLAAPTGDLADARGGLHEVFAGMVRSAQPIPLPEPTLRSDALLDWYT
jgi:hypothetical protein